jgi:hydroxymethylglutaryl-CoA lyase
MPEKIKLFEVGPRDGLQNESRAVSFSDREFFVSRLVKAGFKDIEVGAFVRDDRVPQMAASVKLYQELRKADGAAHRGSRFWTLVPNERGLERAIENGAKWIAFFTAATDGFNKSNIGMSVKESLPLITRMAREARSHKIEVRGYVSTVFGCPFDGKVAPKKALSVVETLLDAGIPEVSLGDTIGVATPGDVDAVVKPAVARFGADRIAVHFHDTRGTALANVVRSLDHGVRTVDASAGGLGGCPFAPGATGNVATEDVVYALHGMGFKTGIDLKALCELSLEFHKRIGRPISSRYLQAFASQSKTSRK